MQREPRRLWALSLGVEEGSGSAPGGCCDAARVCGHRLAPGRLGQGAVAGMVEEGLGTDWQRWLGESSMGQVREWVGC